MGPVRFWSLGAVLLLLSVVNAIPNYGLAPRQDDSATATITSGPMLPTLINMPDKISSCPTSFATDYPQEMRVYTSQCEKAPGQLSYFHEYAEECLRVYCAWEWQTAIVSYISANRTDYTTGTYIQWSGAFSTGVSTTIVTSQTRWTSTETRVMFPSEAVKPSAPCCGSCELQARTVELFYWPSTAAVPNATATGGVLPGSGTYVNDAGFTFTSPSVYIAFTSLAGHNRCGNVGTEIYNMTMAFDLTELSSVLPHVVTAHCPVTDTAGHVQTLDETSIPEPVPLTLADVAQNCSSIAGYYYDPDHLYNEGAGDPCHPVIAIPDRVKELQPEWANCGANYYGGFYDPPKTLTAAPVLVPTTASPGPSNPTVVPPTSTSVPSLPQTTDDPDSSSSEPQPDPTSSSQPDPPSSTPDQPDPASSTPDQPDPPSSTPDQPNTPSSTAGQPDPPSSTPDQPNPPTSTPGQPNPPGSSTVIIITPPNPSGSQSGQVPVNTPPVITLEPNPTNPSDPGQVVTVIPTTLPPNPGASQGPGSSGNAVIIGSQTLTPGQVITIGGTTTTGANGQTTVVSGTPVSVDPAGTQLIVGETSTIPLTTPAQTTGDAPFVATLGSTTLTANSQTQFVLGSTTLSVGGSPVTLSGTTYVMTTNSQGSTQLVVGTGGVNSTIAAASPTYPWAPENSVAAAGGLNFNVEVVITVVLVAAFLG